MCADIEIIFVCFVFFAARHIFESRLWISGLYVVSIRPDDYFASSPFTGLWMMSPKLFKKCSHRCEYIGTGPLGSTQAIFINKLSRFSEAQVSAEHK